MKLFRPTLS